MKTILTLGLLLAASALWAADEPIQIGNRRQLFIDQRFIREGQGVSLVMNPPSKLGRVIAGTNGWENGMVSGAGTVIEDQGKFRLWYTALPAATGAIRSDGFFLCYAESDNGIAWTKPNLGRVEWKGSKMNNIVMETAVENAGGVFLDPTAPAEARYKMLAVIYEKQAGALGLKEGPGVYAYLSANGLDWTLHPTRLFPFVPDTVNMAFYDPEVRKYRAYLRVWNPMRRVGLVETDDFLTPWPYRRGIPPRHPGHVSYPTREIDDVFGVDADDPPEVDHYTSAVVRYPWADHAYLMFPSAYHHLPEPPEGLHPSDGPLDVQLAVSRDGRSFARPSRAPYIELGLAGQKDSGSLYMYIGMLRNEDEIYQYYGGYDYGHGGDSGYQEIRNRGGVFLVRQRLDGFVSVDADHRGGSFVTPPVAFQGGKLVVNLNASATGAAWVELRDAQGRALPGYSFAECDPLYQNDTGLTVTWRRGHAELGTLAAQPVQIAFRLRSAKLYAFQFVE